MKVTRVFAAVLVLAAVCLFSACGAKKEKPNRDGDYKLVEMTHEDYIYDQSAIEAAGMDLSVSIKGTEAHMKSDHLKTDNEMTFDPDKSVFTVEGGTTINVTFDGDTMLFEIGEFAYKLKK